MVILKEPFRSIPCGQFQALVDESLITGFKALERLQKEQSDGSNTLDRPGEAVFTARVDGRVIGLCALNYDPFGTDPSVARLRRMYVALATVAWASPPNWPAPLLLRLARASRRSSCAAPKKRFSSTRGWDSCRNPASSTTRIL